MSKIYTVNTQFSYFEAESLSFSFLGNLPETKLTKGSGNKITPCICQSTLVISVTGERKKIMSLIVATMFAFNVSVHNLCAYVWTSDQVCTCEEQCLFSTCFSLSNL